MNEFKERSYFDEDFQLEHHSLTDQEISVDRLNELFYTNSISSQEHSYLLKKLYSVEKRISVFAWLCVSFAVISWVCLLKFDFNGKIFELMSGKNKFYVMSVLAPLVLFFFYLTYRDIKNNQNVKGFKIALIGATIAVAQLTVAIPVWLMRIFLMS